MNKQKTVAKNKESFKSKKQEKNFKIFQFSN